MHTFSQPPIHHPVAQKYEAKHDAERIKAGVKPRKVEDGTPKGPKSAYICFCSRRRDSVKKEGMQAKDVLTALGAAWQKLSEGEKAEFEAAAAADKERFEKEMAEYNKK